MVSNRQMTSIANRDKLQSGLWKSHPLIFPATHSLVPKKEKRTREKETEGRGGRGPLFLIFLFDLFSFLGAESERSQISWDVSNPS